MTGDRKDTNRIMDGVLVSGGNGATSTLDSWETESNGSDKSDGGVSVIVPEVANKNDTTSTAAATGQAVRQPVSNPPITSSNSIHIVRATGSGLEGTESSADPSPGSEEAADSAYKPANTNISMPSLTDTAMTLTTDTTTSRTESWSTAFWNWFFGDDDTRFARSLHESPVTRREGEGWAGWLRSRSAPSGRYRSGNGWSR